MSIFGNIKIEIEKLIGHPPTTPPTMPGVTVLRPFPTGGRVAVGQVSSRIFYDSVNGSGSNATRLRVCSSDGSNDILMPGQDYYLANLNVGNPAVSRDETKIAFLAASGTGMLANPGNGWSNDVVLCSLNGTVIADDALQLTNIGATSGWALHPKFSPDGTKLFWTQSLTGVAWQLAIYTIATGQTQLISVGQPTPYTHFGFVELGSIGADNQTVYLAATDQASAVFKNVYSFNYVTGILMNLTNTTGQWFEFPQISPDGTMVAWVSSEDSGSVPTQQRYPLDLWIYETVAKTYQRITDYNSNGAIAWNCADIEWFPDSQSLAMLLYDMQPGASGQPVRSEAVCRVQG